MKKWNKQKINQIYEYTWMITFIFLIWTLPWIFDINTTKSILIYIFSALGSSAGIIGSWLLSKRSIYNSYFSFFDLLTYSSITIVLGAYFEGFSNMLIPLPLLFYSMFSWRKDSKDNKVNPVVLSKTQKMVYLPIGTIILILLIFGLSILINTPNTSGEYLFKFFDAAGSILTIISIILIIIKAKELALFSGLNNFNAILIWVAYLIMVLNNNEVPLPHAIISIVTTIAFTINSVYTHIMWKEAEENLNNTYRY